MIATDGFRWSARSESLYGNRSWSVNRDADSSVPVLIVRDGVAPGSTRTLLGPATGHLALEPAATVRRPFVMVPGFRTREGAFTPLYQKLTAGGRNGGHVYYVRDGAWFEDRACTQPLPAVPLQARVFEVVFPTRFVTPDEAATSLGHSLRAIRHASGARKLDVEGYSMGGLTARVYLDRGGTDIGRLLLLATPNRGAALANLGRHALRQGIDVAANLARLVPQELPALEWLVADSEKAANARLGELNRNWARQKSNVEAVMAVGTDFHTTLCNRWPGLTDGDGVVTTESMALPDGQLTVLREQGHKRHGRLNGDPEVYREMLAFFGWA